MGTLDRHWRKIVALVILVSLCALFRPRVNEPPSDPNGETPEVSAPSLLGERPPGEDPVAETELEELSEDERHKRIDIENMTQIHAALMAFKEETGHFPEALSDLVPAHLNAQYLKSPREGEGYNFEFRNTVFRDGRTWEEIKEVQRMEWGDVIPLLRSFNHGPDDNIVVNMSYGGVPYETLMNWEWDPNTLDVIAKLGWGPGLSVGEFTEVTVTDAQGQPAEGAEVWASGRTYTFDLPDRPFLTDAEGVARIPLGADLDRTKLGLRVRAADGRAAASIGYPKGTPPVEAAFTLTSTQNLGGVLIDDGGDALANTWIYFRNGGNAAPLGAVKTDAQGQWNIPLPEGDLAQLTTIPAPPGVVPKFSPGTRVDTASALHGEAEVVHQGKE